MGKDGHNYIIHPVTGISEWKFIDIPAKQEILARLKGQRIPIVGRVEIYVIDEAQPRWLAFLNGEHDLLE